MWLSRPPQLLICFIFTLTCSVYAIERNPDGSCPSTANITCKNGVLLPVWKPVKDISIGYQSARAIVYFLMLMYCFLGVSIIADRFMAAIEVITSQEKEVRIKTKSGEYQLVTVRIWNATVSNLTLMALGSSAPEILLSIIEICGAGFEAGELGPSTIVGSAAFNLFVIIGICIVVIPKGESRRVKHLSVFFITASASIFAYLWLYFILAVSSKGIVDFWEAFLTFLFFPIIVVAAYVADTKLFQKKFMKKRYRLRRERRKRGLHTTDELESNGKIPNVTIDAPTESKDTFLQEEFEKTRMDYIDTIKEIRKNNPTIEPKELEELAQMEVLNRGPKSRAFYRIQATRQLTGSGNVVTKSKLERKLSTHSIEIKELYGPEVQQFLFDPGHYTVMENVGTFNVTVSRKGGNLSNEVAIDYSTEDGTAIAGEDYIMTKGTLVFRSNEVHKHISITVIDDDVFEEDEHFNVRIQNLRIVSSQDANPDCRIVDPTVATVMVLDDDHCGIFQFGSESTEVNEACGFAEFTVCRSSGARGVVRLPFHTVEGTAKGNGTDYMETSGYIEFQNDQTEAVIRVPIVDDNDYEKDEYFFIELETPIPMEKEGLRSLFTTLKSHEDGPETTTHMRKVDPKTLNLPEDRKEAEELLEKQGIDTGKPRLGQYTRLRVNIRESVEFKNTVDRLVKQGKWALLVGTSSWKEQFLDAITVSSGGENDLDAIALGEVKLPSCMDYVMHFLTVFWKVMFACVPPTDYAKGWVCFVVCIIVIGFLTAVIGDLASAFGCTVGLTDAVTATTFVALGTSLPDTFASKVAAVGDQYADSSIGNVTGSNAVNVFLGIGVAWTIAAIVHWSRGTVFYVPPGSLGFSVTIFVIFAVVAIILLFLRRRPALGGGELGGEPLIIKWSSSAFYILLWVVYVLLTSMENYCHIGGF